MRTAQKTLAGASALVLCFFAFSNGLMRAQSILDGKIVGTITDDKREPLPGVSVEVTSPALMGKRTAVTSAKGTYVLTNLPVGRYKLTASLPNFKTVIESDIIITAGGTASVNLVLPLGTIEESVTVLGAAPVVDAKTSTIDSRINKEMLDKLPTSRDSFYDLSLSAPGMFDVGKNVMGSPTAYGGATTENIFLVNGVDTTNPSGAGFGSMINVNYNNVQEVRLISLGSKAEYGNFSGVAIDVITKSGSEKLGGSLAGYSQLGYPKNGSVPKAGDLGRSWLYLQPGDSYLSYPKSDAELDVTFGGPLISKNLWFFTAFNLLDKQEKQLNYSPIAKAVDRYADVKITSAPLKNNYAWLSYHYENNRSSGTTDGTLDWDPSMAYNGFTQSHSVSTQWQWFPSVATGFSAKFLGFWVHNHNGLPAGAPDFPGYLNWWKGIPFDMGVAGAYPGVQNSLTSRTTVQADMSHYAENFLGQHDIKFGAQWTRGRLNGVFGDLFGKNLIDPETGENLGFFGFYNTAYPYRWTYDAAYMQNTYGDPGFLMYVPVSFSNPHRSIRTSDALGIFFDDQWTPVKRLTLNIGLRWDRMTAKFLTGQMLEQPTTPQGFEGNLVATRDTAASPLLFDFRNLSPRVGLTYALTRDQKTVFRASFGRYYTPIGVESFGSGGPNLDRTYVETMYYAVPWEGLDVDNDGLIFGPDVANAARQLPGLSPINSGDFLTTLRSVDYSYGLRIHPGLKNQHTDQFTINLEREIFKNFSLSATYINRVTSDIIVQWPIIRGSNPAQGWDYEIKTQTINGQTVSLYSIKLEDYNQDGVIDINDVVWVRDNADFEWRNMPGQDFAAGGTGLAKRTFQGVQLTFNKRYSNRWQMMGSLLFNHSSGFAARSKRQDQDYNMEGTNIWNDKWLGGINQTINNMTGPLPFTPRFEFKLNGNYTIPKVEVDLGFRFRLHTGRPVWTLADARVVDSYASELPPPDILASSIIDTGQGMSFQIVAQDPTHPNYLPVLSIIDLRLEKTFKVWRGQIRVMLDGFNILNSVDVINAGAKRIEKSGLLVQDVGRVVGLTTPRTFRLGLMYEF